MNKLSKLTAAVIVFMLLVTNAAQAQDRTYIDGRNAADADVLPFSGAVMVGDTLYISGMLGLVNGQVPDDPEEEARQIMESFKSTLEEAGMTMDDLAYVTIYCSDVAHYDAFNRVYRSYFTREFPARAFIGSGALLFNARFEMQAIAVKRGD